jgi:hypothetical protein
MEAPMPSYSPVLFAPITDPFLLADMRGLDLEPEYCVGNSHAFTVAEFDDGTAECACGGLLRAPRDGDRHFNAETVHDATGAMHCPAYGCQSCYRVHNQPAGAQLYPAARLALMGPHAMRRVVEFARADLADDAVTYLGMDRAQTRATAARTVADIVAVLDRTVS